MFDDAELDRILEGWRKIIKNKLDMGYSVSMNVYAEDTSMATFTIVVSKASPYQEHSYIDIRIEDGNPDLK